MTTSTWFSRSSDRCFEFGAVLASLAMSIGCADDAQPTAKERSALVAACAESADTVPDGAWICGNSLTMECDAHPGTASPATIYVVREAGCDGVEYSVAPGPFTLGRTEVVVSERRVATNGETTLREVCRSELVVVDTVPPASNSMQSSVWPPNHKLHSLSAADCSRVTDACDPAPDVRFLAASSDEPPDAEGDGSQTPDIVFDGPSTVSLRAERQGGGNGRVYVLGWVATDGSGNATQGMCTVAVPHDSSGRDAVADAMAYAVPAPAN